MVQSKEITKKNKKSKKMVPIIEFSGQKKNPRFLHQLPTSFQTTTSNPLNLRAQQRILGSKQHTAKTEAASTPQHRGFGFLFRVGRCEPGKKILRSFPLNPGCLIGILIWWFFYKKNCTTQPTRCFFTWLMYFFVNMLAQKKDFFCVNKCFCGY